MSFVLQDDTIVCEKDTPNGYWHAWWDMRSIEYVVIFQQYKENIYNRNGESIVEIS